MSVRVPFHLRRRAEPAPAAGLLLLGDDPAIILATCARLAEPLLFSVADGFLLVADTIPDVVPHALRLRRLSENFFLPVDADLVPALRPAEAVDLTASRGLIFLPNKVPLAFDAKNPLKPATFLAVAKPRRDDWEPFPAGNPPADKLTAIIREITIPPEELLEGGGPPIGTEDARPPQVGPGRRTIGRLSTGLGKGIGALGRAMGSSRLGKLGGKLAGLGAALAPRITEELLGKQEAALQQLLKKFRGGDTDEALRKAIPIGNDPGRGGGMYGSDQLPTNSLKWSFGGLFGGGGGRGAPVWAGGNPETWRDLMAEYRRAAQQAADRGDFRRAALIYAKLLTDYRAAAEVLSRGGLHREAGILFRDKVRHTDRAAQEFEKAGEYDEALKLFREAFLFVEAGDLLGRLGEEAAAIAEYHKAAERAVELRSDYVEAGDLMLKKTGRADLAGAYFAHGWEHRQSTLALSKNAVACAERLIEIYAFAEPRDPFWQVLGEAEDWLQEPGWSADAGRFFNKVVRLAELKHLHSDRPVIRDRARLGLALKVRQHAKGESTPGTVVADLFGAHGHWTPSVVSDADFALRAICKQRPKHQKTSERATTITRLRDGVVTAVVQAPDSGDLFIGFKDGAVVHFDSVGGTRVMAPATGLPVFGLATDAAGLWLAILKVDSPQVPNEIAEPFALELVARRPPGGAAQSARTQWIQASNTMLGLLPTIELGPEDNSVGVSKTDGIFWYSLPGLLPPVGSGASASGPATMHLKLRIPYCGDASSLTFQGGAVSWAGSKVFVGWMPESAARTTLYSPPIAWLVASPVHVELAGLFDKATLYWTEVERRPDRLGSRTIPFVAPGGFRAVSVWRAGNVIGITDANRILWLRARGTRFEEWAPPTELKMPSHTVGCFPSRKTNELLVVMDDGSLVRVPVPT